MSACPERCLIVPYRRRYFPRYKHYQRDGEGVWDIEVLRAWLTVIKWQLKARNPVCLSWDLFFLFWSLPHSWFEQPNGFSQQSSSASFSEMLLSFKKTCFSMWPRLYQNYQNKMLSLSQHFKTQQCIYIEVLNTLKHWDSWPLVSLWSWFIDALIFWLHLVIFAPKMVTICQIRWLDRKKGQPKEFRLECQVFFCRPNSFAAGPLQRKYKKVSFGRYVMLPLSRLCLYSFAQLTFIGCLPCTSHRGISSDTSFEEGKG